MKLNHTLLALATSLLAIGSARADEFEVFTYTGGNSFSTAEANLTDAVAYTPTVLWKVGTTNGSGARPLAVKNYSNSTSFIAFCFEPLQALSAASGNDAVGNDVPTSTETYTSGALSSSTANNNVQRLFDLWGYRVSLALDRNLYPNAAAAGADARKYYAAMQLSIWNLVTDTDFTVSSGNFQLRIPASATAGVEALANTMLADVNNPNALGGDPNNLVLGGIQRNTLVWSSASSQDLIQSAGVIPEPSAFALIAAGLGVVGFSLRRRPHTPV